MILGLVEALLGTAFAVVVWLYEKNLNFNKDLDKRIDAIEILLVEQKSNMALLEQRSTYQADLLGNEVVELKLLVKATHKRLDELVSCSNHKDRAS